MTSETEQLEEALEADNAAHAGKKPDTEPTPEKAPEVDAAPAKKKTAKKKVVKKKATPPPQNDTLAETRKKLDEARKAAIAEAEKQSPGLAPPSEADQAEEARRAAIRQELEELDQAIGQAEVAIEQFRARMRELMVELYPQTVESDRHVDAVRGYLDASAKERENRGVHPARLKEMLVRAGKAPIDAAFQRAKSRGTHRPHRTPMTSGSTPAPDQSKNATPGAEG